MTKIWAHRGASGYAPENTIEAYKLAIDMMADGLELDVHESKDGELMVIHDETVDRTSDSTGRVVDKTCAELKRIDFGMGKKGYEGAKIPMLAEVYELIKPTSLTINVEIKCDVVVYWGIWDKLFALEKEMGMQGRILYSSFNHYVLMELRKIAPESEIGLLYDCAIFEPWKYAKQVGAQAIHPNYRVLECPGLPEGCHAAGIDINPWTVNTEEDMRMCIKSGTNSIITNYPDVARKVVYGK